MIFPKILWIIKKYTQNADENISNEEQTEKNTIYPLDELKKYVGSPIEVHYIAQDTPKVETGLLRYPPTDTFFYIGQGEGYHIIYWDYTDTDGKRYCVRLIKDSTGKEIYRNNEITY